MFRLNVNPGADPKTDPTAKAAAKILRESRPNLSSSPRLMIFGTEVAGEEVLHLGLVSNILRDVGRSPMLSSEYPTAIFKQGVMLNLRSAKTNMQTFARVRYKKLHLPRLGFLNVQNT
jgi:hypothetical protein